MCQKGFFFESCLYFGSEINVQYRIDSIDYPSLKHRQRGSRKRHVWRIDMVHFWTTELCPLQTWTWWRDSWRSIMTWHTTPWTVVLWWSQRVLSENQRLLREFSLLLKSHCFCFFSSYFGLWSNYSIVGQCKIFTIQPLCHYDIMTEAWSIVYRFHFSSFSCFQNRRKLNCVINRWFSQFVVWHQREEAFTHITQLWMWRYNRYWIISNVVMFSLSSKCPLSSVWWRGTRSYIFWNLNLRICELNTTTPNATKEIQPHEFLIIFC